MDISPAFKYQQLISRFLNHQIDGLTFERDYLDLFKYEKSPLTEELYEVLNTLFYSVDDFVADPEFLEELRNDGDVVVGEPELRKECQKAYEQLEALRGTDGESRVEEEG